MPNHHSDSNQAASEYINEQRIQSAQVAPPEGTLKTFTIQSERK